MQKRRVERRMPKSTVDVSLLVDGYVVAHGELADLSPQGAGIWTTEGFKKGDLVDLRLESGGILDISFRTRAKIVWFNPSIGASLRSRCGVRWAHLPSYEKDSLDRFMADICMDQ